MNKKHNRILAGRQAFCFKPRCSAGCAIILVGIIGFLLVAFCRAEPSSNPVADTRVALEKWVQTQRIISQEKRDLLLSKEMLNERIDLLRREIESMQQKNTDAKASIAEADKKRAGMLEENDALKNISGTLANKASGMEAGIKMLLVKLPDPIRARVKPLSQRLPEDVDTAKLSISERFQNVVGILNEIDKFNRDISVTSEIRTMPDGNSVEVAVIYFGLGQAYFASADGKVAGTGMMSDHGWVWNLDNNAAGKIAEVIAIFKNEKVAAFVALPINIK